MFEIFTIKPDIEWKLNKDEYTGTFILNNKDVEITIVKIVSNNKVLTELGFKVDGSNIASNSGKISNKLMGSVVNSLSDKLKEINPDLVLLTVYKDAGLVDSRKSLYSRIIHRIESRSGIFMFHTDWIENSKYFRMLVSRENLTKDQVDYFTKIVMTK